MVYGRYFDLPRALLRQRAAELLEFVQLTERARDRVDPLSGGMKRRLTIARALVNEPELLLLDEPTTGLDPQARHLVWDRLYRLKQRGTTLVLTTHYMDEAEQLCDRLVVMDGGRIVAEGPPAELIRTHSTKEVLELRFPAGEPDVDLSMVDGLAARIERLPDRVLVYTEDSDAVAARISAAGLTPLTSLTRRSTPRGRVPPAHRPPAGRVMATPPAARYLEHELVVYRRLWRSSLASSFLAPMPVPRRHRRHPRPFHRPARASLGWAAWATSRGWHRACSPPTPCRSPFRSASTPSSAGSSGRRNFIAAAATPLRPADVVVGWLSWVALRTTLVSAVYVFVAVVFGAAHSPEIVVGIPVAALTGMAFAAPATAWSATRPAGRVVLRPAAVLRAPPVPVLGGVLPHQSTPRRHPPHRLPPAPLAWCRPLPRPGARPGRAVGVPRPCRGAPRLHRRRGRRRRGGLPRRLAA